MLVCLASKNIYKNGKNSSLGHSYHSCPLVLCIIACLWYHLCGLIGGFDFLQSLVPLGSVEELLAAYDSQRRELPPPVTMWEWGWTKSAETWNGRAAMLAVLVLLVLEVTTGEGFLHQWGILPLFRWISLPLCLSYPREINEATCKFCLCILLAS